MWCQHRWLQPSARLGDILPLVLLQSKHPIYKLVGRPKYGTPGERIVRPSVDRFRKGKINGCAAIWPEYAFSEVCGGHRDVGANVKQALWLSIYRERRRLAFVITMAFAAGFLFYLRADLYIHGIHVSFVTGLIYALVVGAAALVVCLALPSMRFMIEAVAVSRLMLSLLVIAAPDIGFKILASPMLTAFLVVMGGALISRLIHGRILSDRPQGLRARLLPGKAMFQRAPVTIVGKSWQNRFVTWVDGAAPTPG